MKHGEALEAIIRKIVREELAARVPGVATPLTPETFSEPEFCKRVGISPRTAQRLRKRGRLSFYRPTPGRVRYTEEHVAEFLKASEKVRKRR